MVKFLYRLVPGARASRRHAGVRPARNVVSVECEGASVLLDLRRDLFFGLDEVGTLVWREIERGGTVDTAAQRICDEYDAPETTARRDAERFVSELAQRGLVVAA